MDYIAEIPCSLSGGAVHDTENSVIYRFLLLLWDSLNRVALAGLYSVDQAGLNFIELHLPACVSWVLG